MSAGGGARGRKGRERGIVDGAHVNAPGGEGNGGGAEVCFVSEPVRERGKREGRMMSECLK